MKSGAVIKEFRLKKKISQKDFSELLEISQTYLSQIEGDKRTPSMDLLHDIAEKLGVPAYYFLFKGLEIESEVVEDKREAYKQLSPAINSMIEKFFLD